MKPPRYTQVNKSIVRNLKIPRYFKPLIVLLLVTFTGHIFLRLLSALFSGSDDTGSIRQHFQLQPEDLEIINRAIKDDPNLQADVSRPEDIPYNLEFLKLKPEDLEILKDSTLAQDDPKLVAVVRRMLLPPSLEPYNFENPLLNDPESDLDPSCGQSQAVHDILSGFGPNGFFLDCGAYDGEWYTNTLWGEKKLGWNGILIEADPRPLKYLLAKNRKAYIGSFCLSTTPHPQTVSFYLDELNNGLGSGLIKSEQYYATKSVQVQCIPLYTAMLAVGRTTVDFFSLDVEGNEIDIIRTLPEDAIFKVITIEHDVLKEGKLGLRNFMIERGYTFYGTVETENFVCGDSIFIHNSVVPTLTEEQRSRMGFDNQNYSRPTRN